MNQHAMEKMQIVSGFLPSNLAAGGGAGDWVSLRNYGRCALVLFKAPGTAGDDPTLVIEQALDINGTGAKALTFDRIDVKQGADLGVIGQFTKLEFDTASDSYTEDTAAEAQAIWVVDIKAEDLDIDGNYTSIRATVADTGTGPQLAALLYVLHDPAYQTAPLPSAIVD